MTIVEQPTTTTVDADLPAVAFDTYRDIHKGIRAELFGLTLEAGSTDPASAAGRAALAARVRATVQFLLDHAEHEDRVIQPVLEARLPDIAARIAVDHPALEARMEVLVALADQAEVAPRAQQRRRVHRLYLELASFTSAYLAHQDVEERVVMPALDAAVGVEAVLAMHGAIVGSIPPEHLAVGLSMMLPALNVDDRTELLGGMRATVPAPVFEGVWGLAGSVLRPADHAAVAERLGIG
jgi:hypothetical protein